MSQKILLIAICFNLAMVFSTLYERKYLWTLYWTGAVILNLAVYNMKK